MVANRLDTSRRREMGGWSGLAGIEDCRCVAVAFPHRPLKFQILYCPRLFFLTT